MNRTYSPGRLASDDLADACRGVNVISLVSDQGQGRSEGLALTPLEAMSCGLPILVGNQEGSQGAALASADGTSNGYVLNSFDLGTHACRIINLVRSDVLQRQMSSSARLTGERFFCYQRFIEQHRQLYAQVPSKRRPRMGLSGSLEA